MRNSSAFALAVLLAAAPLHASRLTLEDAAGNLQEAVEAQPGAQPILAVAPGAAPSQAPALPRSFRIDEKVLSWTTSFRLRDESKQHALGEITKKLFSWTTTFTYKDASGNVVALAHAKLFSWGTQIVVEDEAGRKIGTIKENVLKSLFKVHTVYSILDGADKEVAVSEKTDWITTNFEIHDKNGRLVAKMHRGFFNVFADHWDVQLGDSGAVDSRVTVMIAAYKTDVDNQRRAEESKKNDDDKK
jgi:uncharacterized protein YxjI